MRFSMYRFPILKNQPTSYFEKESFEICKKVGSEPGKYLSEGCVPKLKYFCSLEIWDSFGGDLTTTDVVNEADREQVVVPNGDDAIFISLDKEMFEYICESILPCFWKVFKFFGKCLPMLGPEQLINLQYFLKERRLDKGSLLFEEGDKPEYVYFIKEGTVLLTKKKAESEIHQPRERSRPKGEPKGLEVIYLKHPKKYHRYEKILLLEKTSMVGFSETFSHGVSKYRATVHSATFVAWAIRAKDFYRYLEDKHEMFEKLNRKSDTIENFYEVQEMQNKRFGMKNAKAWTEGFKQKLKQGE
jgi:CRP-like cAMP-binding protein